MVFRAVKICSFLSIFRLKSLKNHIWNEHPCEKASRATQKVSILELRMPYFCNLEL